MPLKGPQICFKDAEHRFRKVCLMTALRQFSDDFVLPNNVSPDLGNVLIGLRKMRLFQPDAVHLS